MTTLREWFTALKWWQRAGVVLAALFVCGLLVPSGDEEPVERPATEESTAPSGAEPEAEEAMAVEEDPFEIVPREGFSIASPDEFDRMVQAGEEIIATNDTQDCMTPKPGHAASVARQLDGEPVVGPAARFDETELGSVTMAVVFENGSLGVTQCRPEEGCKAWSNPDWQTLDSPRVAAACVARMLSGDIEAAAPSPEPKPTDTPQPEGFGDGTHRVGDDIAPGIYRNPEVGSGCYWARLSGFSGDLDELIANDNAIGSAIIEILDSDVGFESKRCGRWIKGIERVTNSMASFGEGTYAVGVDFEPGQYRNSGGDGCYWARLGNFQNDLGSIIANDNVNGQTIVDIAATDVGFESKRCGNWERLE